MDPSLLESHKSFPVFVALDGMRKGRLERFLSVFADIRAGEGGGALLLTTNGFVLLSAYHILKTIRESLILSQQGPEGKMYTSAGMALLLLLLVPAYGAIASRAIRVKLIFWVALFLSHILRFSPRLASTESASAWRFFCGSASAISC